MAAWNSQNTKIIICFDFLSSQTAKFQDRRKCHALVTKQIWSKKWLDADSVLLFFVRINFDYQRNVKVKTVRKKMGCFLGKQDINDIHPDTFQVHNIDHEVR